MLTLHLQVEEERAASSRGGSSVLQGSTEPEPLEGGQKCASVVDKTIMVLDMPKKFKKRYKLPKSQMMLPEIWAEALKDLNNWEVKELLWDSL